MPTEEADHRDVRLGDLHPQASQACEGVVGAGFTKGIDGMQSVTVLQAILDEALPFPNDCTLLAVLESDCILEATWDQSAGLASLHEPRHAPFVAALDGPVLAAVGLGNHPE
eukprot:CAMPEP_0204058880 /NCGR_PEP_ID=MMETSP0360-20130528/136720_1 /ASSEMBLY_ACC=CAM_ASM_000342 /TAXON_ID=268821 /ORGANISM="Scrippsiella Hangoei, Strain SHTV-5" /LENGTH=111 /DNA_ID=CAMNT_0051006439 /DNA_START=228 /DNA_END=564 /DNA_ORIENTATION=+